MMKKKNKQTKQNKSKNIKRRKEIKIAVSLAIPSPISTTKDVKCCSNGYIYHLVDYIVLMLFVNASFIHPV